MVRSLKRNQTAAFKDLDKILEVYKLALALNLLERLSIALYNLNPAKFVGHITAE